MSLEIKINGVKVSIPKGQTISYNLSNFEITDIGNRKLNYTNSFQIPREGNEMVFGFASSTSETSNVPYSVLSIDIIADGIEVIKSGSAYIKSFSDGFYELQVTEGKDLINEMKNTLLSSMWVGHQIYNSTDANVRSLITATSGFKIPMIIDDWNIYDTPFHTAGASTGMYEWRWNRQQLSLFVKSLFSQYTTLKGVTFSGDLWTDSYFSNMQMMVFNCNQDLNYIKDIIVHPSKSFYDVFKAVLQIFGASYSINDDSITLFKLDNMSLTNYVDWSDKIVSVNSKQFSIPGTGQNNYLRYDVSSDTDKSYNQSVIPCNNNNVPFDVELMKFDAKLYPIIQLDMYSGYTNQPTIYVKDNLVKVDSNGVSNREVKDFVFIIDSAFEMWTGLLINTGVVYAYSVLSTDHAKLPTYFNSQNEYNKIRDMLYNPVFYEVDVLLNILDVAFFDNSKFVYIKQLGGLFYVNSIKDYLLNSDDKSATVELIKMNTYIAP